MILNDFIHILSDAIQQHEGWLATGAASYENMNPGNLGFAHQPTATQNGRWAKFPTFQDGKQALNNDLMAKLDAGIDTIRKILEVYAPAWENDTNAYIDAVIAFMAKRNVKIGPDDAIRAFAANYKAPTIVVAVNQLWDPASWAAINQALELASSYMPAYVFTTRYSDIDLAPYITEVTQTLPPTTWSGVSPAGAIACLKPYWQGQTINVAIYDGKIMEGKPQPYGGCEFHGASLGECTAVATVMWQGNDFFEWASRALFHEIIHGLFQLVGRPDTLHEYEIAHGGYNNNTLEDLKAVFSGNDLNSPAAVANLLAIEIDLIAKVAQQLN